jgi:ligand-binding sensor domain-containing protein/signal transduction histidine kinase
MTALVGWYRWKAGQRGSTATLAGAASFAGTALAVLFVLVFPAIALALQTNAAGTVAVQPSVSQEAEKPDQPRPGDMLSTLADFNFSTFTTRQGLPSDSVYSIAQDRAGFIWIGTFGGLARFDGYRLQPYLTDPDDPQSLPDLQVRALLSLADGRMLMGGGGSGVSLFDPVTGRFSRLAAATPALAVSRIYTLADDGQGGAWVGSQDGLARVGPDLVSVTPVSLPEPASVFAIMTDRAGTLWIGTNRGLLRRSAGQEGFSVVPGQGGKADTHAVWALMQDATGRIWVGRDGAGVQTLDPDRNQTVPYPRLSGPDSAIGINTVRGFAEPVPGEIWIVTYGAGLVVLDPKTGQFKVQIRDLTSAAPLSNDFMRGLTVDHTGIVWIATDIGVSAANAQARGILSLNTAPQRTSGLRASNVVSIATTMRGQVLVGSNRGEVEIIQPDGRIISIRLPGNRVIGAMAEDDEGFVWIVGQGVHRLSTRDFSLETIDLPILDRRTVTSVTTVGDLIWIATFDGLARYNRRTGASRLFRSDRSDPNSLSDNLVRVLFKAPDGRLWITTGNGISVLRPDGESFDRIMPDRADPTSLSGERAFSMTADSLGRVWVGTVGAGISVLEDWPAGGKPRFRRLGRKQGLPSDTVMMMAAGADGRVWLNTSGTVAAIDPQDFAVRRYSAADGLQQWQVPNFTSVAPLKDGTILFPGSGNLTMIRPERLGSERPVSRLAPARIRIGGQPVAVGIGPDGLATGPLLIPPKGGGLEVEFTLLDFAAPQLTRYAYRLEGFDTDWTESGADRRTATYTNLPPGSYRLLARASTDEQGWDRAALLTLPVVVLPAWHETVWFRIVQVVAAIAAVSLVVLGRTAILRRRQRELEAIVVERTNTLREVNSELAQAGQDLRQKNLAVEQALADLQTAQAQLVQQEKTAALGGLVAGVAHEVNTPLGVVITALSGLSRMVSDLRDAVTEGKLTKSRLKLMIDEGTELSDLGERNVRRVAGLIGSFKSVAVQESQMEVDTADLAELIRQSTMVQCAELTRHGHTVRLDLPDGLVLTLMPASLTDVLTRVMANVVDHAFPGDRKGTVQITLTDQGIHGVEIAVIDDGIGIPDSIRPKLFEPFSTTKRGLGGHIGLGLHVAFNHVVQHLQGSISAADTPGGGTTILITLPLVRQVSEG